MISDMIQRAVAKSLGLDPVTTGDDQLADVLEGRAEIRYTLDADGNPVGEIVYLDE